MNIWLHPSTSRGHVQAGWLNTYHSFSFGEWHDPRYMGVSALRVINEDRIAAHQGFGRHPHNNMEILTYVLSGELTHQDSMGNHGTIRAGEWQLMSAGSGVQHSEYNHSDQTVHLLQIWLFPNVKNAAPTYQQTLLDPYQAPNQWHVVVAPDDSGVLHIRQNAKVLTAVLDADHTLDLAHTQGISYLHVIAGEATLRSASGDLITLSAGDALACQDVLTVQTNHQAHLLWFDLPA